MNMNKRLMALVAVIAMFATACSGPSKEQVYEERVYVFGTLADITIYGAPQDQARQAVAAVAQDFQRWHHEWHAWEPSPLTELNDAIAAARAVPVPTSLQPLILKSQDVFAQSEGLFNPAIGKLLRLWGFQSSERPNGPPPAADAIEALVKQTPAMSDLRLMDGVLTSTNPAVQLDFGGIAKGYAVDLALLKLRDFGIHNAIVNAGGGLGVIGSRGERPWRVGIRHPQGAGVLASIEVRDGESVHTSGNYERFRQHENLRYAHILDPRTGWPVEGITSATVIHPDGTVADAAATVLVIAGPDEWHRLAQRMGIRYAMLVDETGTVYMNQAMAERVQFTGEAPKNIVISPPL